MKFILHGCYGKMGRVVAAAAADAPDVEILCGIDHATNATNSTLRFPVFADFDHCTYSADAVIDFSHPSALKPLLAWCIQNRCPAVIATTGLSPEHHRILQEASKQIPLFQSSNMSLGVYAFCEILKILTPMLGDGFDVEIVEKHHKRKADAPSGTTFMLEDAIGKSCPAHSVRAGTIPGEHTVIYAGPDEVIELTHTALSRSIFARGALAAAGFLVKQKPALYSMKDLF